jgi:hypothetical protein
MPVHKTDNRDIQGMELTSSIQRQCSGQIYVKGMFEKRGCVSARAQQLTVSLFVPTFFTSIDVCAKSKGGAAWVLGRFHKSR